MKRKNALPELLSPAGDFESLCAAVLAGADAVYVGGKSFGARAYAKNFDIEELSRAVNLCHLHGVKLYVTVNTLVYDKEMRELSDFAAELWRIGVDAVITADLGAIREIRRRTPGLEIHASTQMSVHNTFGADEAAKLGCKRVVLARELPLSDIKRVTEKCKAETEVFLHGALCVCHSGQCLMSSLVGGRSGNRGECAQPCRLPYNNGKHILSLSDLSLANHINELIESGVASLKIEGRMKSPEYVYKVTSIYRRLLDEARCADGAENGELRAAFSRGGFTDGYFINKKFSKMTGVRSEADKELTRAAGKSRFEPPRARIRAEAVIKRGERARLTLERGEKRVTVYGDAPTEAITSPLSETDVKQRLSKMGATLLSLSEEDITLELDGGINLPPSAINALRREAAGKLEDAGREPVNTVYEPTPCEKRDEKPLNTALIFSQKTYNAVSVKEEFDVCFLPLEEYAAGAEGVYLPPVIFDSELDGVKKLLERAVSLGAKYALIGNIGHIELAKMYTLVPIGDFRLNITNTGSRLEYEKLGVLRCILSPEITLPMARDIGGGEAVYGRIPLMITERCFVKENFGCSSCGNAYLTDRQGAKFPIIREYGHRNLILNSRPTYMGDKRDELRAAKISHAHFIFTTESAKEIETVMRAYKSGRSLSGEVRRIGKR